jgi:response regulator RpfG family c-di-GMP phosphodiesterase
MSLVEHAGAGDRMPPILLVDDEDIVLEALHQILQDAHYEVVAISKPIVALEELRTREFSMVISDQRMPGITGLELLAQARQLQPNATRILITGVLNLDTVVSAINQGEIFRFVVKPWLLEEFLATAQNGMQRFQMLRQNVRLQEQASLLNQELVDLNRSLQQQIEFADRQNQELKRANEALEGNFLRSLELCVLSLHTFYPPLGNRARRALRLARTLATVLNLAPDGQRILESSALLHDIGLISAPRHIIRLWQEDPNQLEPEEHSIIRQHPILGQQLATFGSGLDQVGEAIRAHHEQFDGGGYPDGLEGDDIPWMGRLLAVIAAYVSSPLPSADALEEIAAGGGSLFDPEAIRALLRAAVHPMSQAQESEIALNDLHPGMVLACGIYSSNGKLLLPEGQRPGAMIAHTLCLHDRPNPNTKPLAVYG